MAVDIDELVRTRNDTRRAVPRSGTPRRRVVQDLDDEDAKIARAIRRYEDEFPPDDYGDDDDYIDDRPPRPPSSRQRRQPPQQYPPDLYGPPLPPAPPAPAPARTGIFRRRTSDRRNRNDPLYEQANGYGNGSAATRTGTATVARPSSSRWSMLFTITTVLFMFLVLGISFWGMTSPNTQADYIYSLRWLYAIQALLAIEIMMAGLWAHSRINT